MARQKAQRFAQRAVTIAQLEAKLSQNPASPLFARLADEYLAAGKVKEARALCISGLQQFPAYPTAYLILARCCEEEGDAQSARDSVSIALDHLPFAPLLHDLQVELTEKLGPAAAIIDEAPEQASIEAAQPESQEETGATSTEEPAVEDELTPVTPLEDELRRSLEEHLHEVLGGEPVAETPAETPIEETNPSVKIGGAESPWKDPEEVERNPDEIEQFFSERISELHVDSLPEIEPQAPENVATTNDAPVEEVLAEEPPVEEAPVEEAPSEETPAQEAPAAEAPAPAAETAAYVPPPPIPEEADIVDETTSLSVDGRIVSRTLAEIYVMQGAFAEAILTYQLLKLEKPELRAECDARIRELEPKLQDKPSM